ncbi:hypothetical protein JAK24_09280 [Stenotrophomonas maltophilia]|nr:hypothetical protein [Stenotrophomonas maltophilia]
MMGALRLGVICGLLLATGLAHAGPAYVDARLYPNQAEGWQRFLAIERVLVRGFDDICGDTFCEGEYYNLQAMRLRCSVNQDTGLLAGCIWTFAGSNTSVRRDGHIEVDVRSFACPLPLAADTSLAAFLHTLEAAPAHDAINVALPGTSATVYEGLRECI